MRQLVTALLMLAFAHETVACSPGTAVPPELAAPKAGLLLHQVPADGSGVIMLKIEIADVFEPIATIRANTDRSETPPSKTSSSPARSAPQSAMHWRV